MATYKQVSYGSTGSEVTELQKLLNQKGNYNLATDGVYGAKTQEAVKDYQQKNSLAVDGIAGDQTWGSLTAQAPSAAPAAPGGTAAATPAQPEATAPSFSYGDYAPSETVAQAEALLQQQMAQKPGQYQSTWAGQLNDTIQQILNQEKFSYDVNKDALYHQYADQYTRQGKLAMMDTMGQAAALTGGYGSSYGQSVGQQAYQAYLQQLNEVVPELYGMALDQHNQERQQLFDQAALMAQMEDQEYGRYMDSMNAYLTERDYLAGRYDTERDYDYGKWADGRDFSYGQFIDDRNMGYQKERDQVADQQWQKEYDFAMQQYLDSQKGSGGGSGSGGTGDKGNTGLTYEQTLELEEKVGNWAEKGVDYLNTQLSYWVSKYGLDADYAADLLMYYFPDEFEEPIDTGVVRLPRKGIGGNSGIRQVQMLN